jgi:hypothetical protein
MVSASWSEKKLVLQNSVAEPAEFAVAIEAAPMRGIWGACYSDAKNGAG